jgi:type IV pilus assembly protein PilQ
MTTQLEKWNTGGRRLAVALMSLILLGSLASTALAGQVSELEWKHKGDEPVLDIKVSTRPSAYDVKSFDGGRRLRLTLKDTTVASNVLDLKGAGIVKGVYPYLAGDGVSSNIDFLLNEPGKLSVDPGRRKFRVSVNRGVSASAEATTSVAAGHNAITNVLYAKLPGNRVQLTLKMAQTPSEPRAFTISNPARISLDFPNTVPHLAKKSIPVKIGAVDSVNVVSAGDRSRVVVSLYQSVPYKAEVQANSYVLTINSPSIAAGTVRPGATHFAGTQIKTKYSVKSINFRRDKNGGAKIMVKLSDPSAGIDIHQQAGDIIVDLLNTSAPERLQKRLDVTDFATPVQYIDTFSQGHNTRIVITPHGPYEHLAYQAGDVFTVNVKPVAKAEAKKSKAEGGEEYTGEKLSLNFQKIAVRDALQVLADFTGLNFIISDAVTGNITLRLKNVPWDQALDIILQSKNLGMKKKGNVVVIAPAKELAAQEKAQLEAKKSTRELEPLVSELIRINYAKATDIAALLKSVKAVASNVGTTSPFQTVSYAGEQKTVSNSLLSKRGQVTVDNRTNSILIQDTPSKIREVRALIAKLDQPVEQVMIEARLVEATSTFARSLGARFGVTSTNTGPNSTTSVTGSLEGNIDILNGSPLNANTDGLNVNLPSTGVGTSPPGQIAYTLATAGGELLQLELSALEQEGRGKIISSPRIITGNQEKATIEQGQEREFSLGAGVAKVQSASLKLEVTPQITPDRRVILDVFVTKDSFDPSSTGLVNKKRVTTNVLLDNGETVAIGGIYEQDKSEQTTQIPVLGHLPMIGWMFKNRERRDNKTELLIFLTPRILSDKVSLR